MTARRQPAPADLGPAGGRLWRRVVEQYELSPVELALLAQACPLVDQLERLNAQVAVEGLTVVGSTGQPRGNPLLDDVRKHTDTLTRLVVAMRLPVGDEEEGRTSASLMAQRAAHARWRRESADGA